MWCHFKSTLTFMARNMTTTGLACSLYIQYRVSRVSFRIVQLECDKQWLESPLTWCNKPGFYQNIMVWCDTLVFFTRVSLQYTVRAYVSVFLGSGRGGPCSDMLRRKMGLLHSKKSRFMRCGVHSHDFKSEVLHQHSVFLSHFKPCLQCLARLDFSQRMPAALSILSHRTY